MWRAARWLHLALGLVTLAAMATSVPGFVARRLPDDLWPGRWVYDAWVAIVAFGFVALVVRAAAKASR